MTTAGALLELFRPRQWVKNAFVLVGLVFGHAWRDPHMVALAAGATVSFCLASGAVYAFNDARDAAQDRGHPDKRRRPVARGALSERQATGAAAVAAALALAVAGALGPVALLIVAAYLALSAAYTLKLKRIPVVDVGVIAAGFMLRLLAGTAGIGIEPSGWLLACGFLLTLFLGFAKRRAEISRLAEGAGRHRAVLESYDARQLDRAILSCAVAMTLAYGLYAASPETERLHGPGLVLTLPWVAAGTARYLVRLRAGGGGDPTEELLRDRGLALCVAGWLATVLWLIG